MRRKRCRHRRNFALNLLPMADTIRTPAEIEDRARAAGLSMSQVCRLAGLHRSIFNKWKAGEKGIMLESVNRLLDAIAAAAASDSAAAE